MHETRSTVVGVFENYDQVKCAEDALRRAGYRDDQIGVVVRREPETVSVRRESSAVEGAAGGAVAGGLLGGLLGAAASLVIPGIGPILAGGILATTLAGVAAGAATGGVLGALVGLGIPEEEARYYDQEFQHGRIIMTVNADPRYGDTWSYLRACGAYNMATRRS